MNILAVDTALGACSVAVLADGRVRAHIFEVMARGHAEALAPMAERAMIEAGLSFSELDRLAVTTGPGTFTGQRVGLAFMRGLRVALKKPLIGLTTLEVMAAQAMAETGTPRAAVIHDARRDEVYLQAIEQGTNHPGPAIMRFAGAMESIGKFARAKRFALAGTAGPRAAASLAGADFSLSGVCAPDALWVARLAADRPAPDGPPAPLYLRPPDAKLPHSSPCPRPFDPSRDDTDALAALHAACFDRAWDSGEIAKLLAGPGVFAFVAGGGFVLARVAGGEAEILTLGVAPPARRRGFGRALLAAAAAAATARGAGSMFLEVGTGNEAALGLYEGAGFVKVGARKAYYGSGAGGDAVVLRAGLPLSLPPKFA